MWWKNFPEKIKKGIGEYQIICEDTNAFLGRLKTENKGGSDKSNISGVPGYWNRASDLVGGSKGGNDTMGSPIVLWSQRVKRRMI